MGYLQIESQKHFCELILLSKCGKSMQLTAISSFFIWMSMSSWSADPLYTSLATVYSPPLLFSFSILTLISAADHRKISFNSVWSIELQRTNMHAEISFCQMNHLPKQNIYCTSQQENKQCWTVCPISDTPIQYLTSTLYKELMHFCAQTWLGRESAGYLCYCSYLGNPQLAAQPRGGSSALSTIM
jgi:hypothetical protein